MPDYLSTDRSCTTTPQGVVTRIRPSGEIDLSTVWLLTDSIARATAVDGADAVVVDLDEVSFIDSTTVAALVAAYRAAAGNGVTLRVVNAHGVVHRVLTVTGVLPLLQQS